MKSRIDSIIITAVITAVVTSMFWVTVGVIGYRYFIPDSAEYSSPPFEVSAEAPEEVALGETLTLNLRVSNPTDKALQLGAIDVYDSLLEGFTVIRSDPRPIGREHYSDYSRFAYAESLAPGTSFSMSLTLKAKQAGTWTGDVDFCAPDENFVSSSVSIVVRDGAESPDTNAPPSE